MCPSLKFLCNISFPDRNLLNVPAWAQIFNSEQFQTFPPTSQCKFLYCPLFENLDHFGLEIGQLTPMMFLRGDKPTRRAKSLNNWSQTFLFYFFDNHWALCTYICWLRWSQTGRILLNLIFSSNGHPNTWFSLSDCPSFVIIYCQSAHPLQPGCYV